ncbi:MAG TPA: hypothetical protein DEP43_00515 [Ruminococcaceae bacterium]|nr:hypothetical protein [Oscillospiraceae bacterium]HAO69016.1 hypothetical protein [Oscillospiraceae bacterium]HCB64436.1 hypothetical protein [Oscillospiraceae bacterium]
MTRHFEQSLFCPLYFLQSFYPRSGFLSPIKTGADSAGFCISPRFVRQQTKTFFCFFLFRNQSRKRFQTHSKIL